ncbi:preprotein translocase subunit SecG [Sporolactobacillus terrae]|uniref:Protein-export membrane protein SecG n=1 Tax=Sporolactobacillus terrae TaxID=269673 RepID=A0ABX5Q5S7_9BACL|nr:preprotein translocase subunit SecG [Sporolactobacillus terrae]QAA22001.1 preprotein translocase subunit SecG [Sporolactobacillus terrae]QAA24974.1 preprotein translocase subunit SecG [Sporolactobacillus terrae]UAK16798.1 preprotein translocase subunit SecG [Sporolactobacillus terrae]
MHTFLITLMIISGILLIALVLVQRSQGDGLSEAITGGAEQLFSKQKARGIEVGLKRLTILFAIVFFACAFVLGYYL